MNVHLINPSSVSFGTAVITPRWQYVLAAATPKTFGDPILIDETLLQLRPDSIHAGDAVGIGIHTANALRGYEIGRMARSRMMYADTGIATDSARVSWSGRWTRWMAKPCRHLFAGRPTPDLEVPAAHRTELDAPSLVPVSS